MAGGQESERLLDLPVGEIDMGERLRPVDPVWAQALGAIMAREGQHTPIQACRLPGHTRWSLVAGGHRLAGAISAGMTTIKAIVVGSDAAERRQREVSENLWRRGLDPLDRAAFVAELVALARVRAGAAQASAQAVAASARWKKDLRNEAVDASAIVADAYGWAAGVADQVGLSLRTVEHDLTLYRRLAPDVRALLAGHPLLRNGAQLHKLAKLAPEAQRRLAGMIARGEAASVSEAQAVERQKPKPSAEAKRLSAVLGNLARMGRAERQAAIEEIFASYPREARAAHGKRNADQLASIGLERPSC